MTTATATGVMDYQAPFLIEKLLKDQVVETAAEGEALFAEVKRYFILVASDDTLVFQMHSLRIDEVWHQFVLFTQEYIDFCQRFFEGYVPHSPGNAPEYRTDTPVKMASFALFRQRYEALFGTPLPDLWYDERTITVRRRILNERAGALIVREADGTVELLSAAGDVLLSVNDLAREALRFIAGTGAFYVRELPGGLEDEEKIALIATLVEGKILRVAS